MSWNRRRLDGVWRMGRIRHAIYENWKRNEEVYWDTQCGIATPRGDFLTAKIPRVFKGFVTCLQCLVQEARYGR